MIFSEIKWPYLFKKTYFRICSGSVCNVGHHVSINNSRIIAVNDSIIEIANNVVIDNATIFVDGGKFIIGEHSIIRGDLNPVLINIEEGETHIGHHSKVSAKRFWIRFGGFYGLVITRILTMAQKCVVTSLFQLVVITKLVMI